MSKKESAAAEAEVQSEQVEDQHEAEEQTDAEFVDEREELIETFSEVSRQALVEALLYASGSPLGEKRLADICKLSREEIVDILDSIKMKLSMEESGVELVEAGGKFQLRTKAEFAPFLQQLRASRPKKLSQQALETLAIVAYRQPIVRSDVEKIRGVDATPTLKTLIDRGFVKIVGHQESIGQPALYGTTQQFLEVFGLSSLQELPSLRDLKQLEAYAEENEDEIETEEVATSPGEESEAATERLVANS